MSNVPASLILQFTAFLCVMTANVASLGFGLSVGQKEQSEGVYVNSGKW